MSGEATTTEVYFPERVGPFVRVGDPEIQESGIASAPYRGALGNLAFVLGYAAAYLSCQHEEDDDTLSGTLHMIAPIMGSLADREDECVFRLTQEAALYLIVWGNIMCDLPPDSTPTPAPPAGGG